MGWGWGGGKGLYIGLYLQSKDSPPPPRAGDLPQIPYKPAAIIPSASHSLTALLTVLPKK